MSLKSIDAQLSLSRIKEIGTIQSQLNHKPADDQAALAAQSQKRIEEERKKSTQLNQTTEMGIKDQSSREKKQQTYLKSSKNEAKEDEQAEIEHPYKGHRIDISL